MKIINHLMISFILLLTATISSNLYAATITVKIGELRNCSGKISLTVFDKKADFPNAESAIFEKRVNPEMKDGEIEAIILLKNISPGYYALSVTHDENDNKKLDTGFLVIPSEGIGGTLNHNGPQLGPPTWEQARIKISNNTILEVSMNYIGGKRKIDLKTCS